ncbi:MAG: hypothetical protein ACREO5_03785 [Candidatus Binatia bacterium]
MASGLLLIWRRRMRILSRSPN